MRDGETCGWSSMHGGMHGVVSELEKQMLRVGLIPPYPHAKFSRDTPAELVFPYTRNNFLSSPGSAMQPCID